MGSSLPHCESTKSWITRYPEENPMEKYQRVLVLAGEMSVLHGVTTSTINLWAREGRLRKHSYDNARRCLYEPLEEGAILKGHGGRRAKQPVFTVAQAE
jgi:hypothetical protein